MSNLLQSTIYRFLRLTVATDLQQLLKSCGTDWKSTLASFAMCQLMRLRAP